MNENISEEESREAIPQELLQIPDEFAGSPPVTPLEMELPFQALSWQNFERLLYRLAAKNSDVEHCALYGRQGQEQLGIDVFARLSSGKYQCWQAKNWEEFSAAEVKKAVSKFADNEWAAKSERFVLCVRGSLADKKIQDEIELQAERLRSQGIAFIPYDGLAISALLKKHPDLVDDFFGRQWLVAFAGQQAADQMSTRLDVKVLGFLRERLAGIYGVRFRQLDPGMTLESSAFDAPDLRSRFVMPDVDVASPYSEPTVEHTDPQLKKPHLPPGTDVGESDGNLFEEVEVAESAATAANSESRLVLEDWLLQGRNLLLLGGAGAGKSTVLRCLALDLLCAPQIFRKAAHQFAQRIPILVSFAMWTKLTEKLEREVALDEVVRETFRALAPSNELEEAVVRSLYDNRLLLLVDGLDEYANDHAARLTLATLESFVALHSVIAIATARPAGLRRLHQVSGSWQPARLTELSTHQQRSLVERLLVGTKPLPIAEPEKLQLRERVDRFFDQLQAAGRLHSLAGVPLLLHGLLSIATRSTFLPQTRFKLFEELVSLLLDTHPSRRSTAAADTRSRSIAFANDDVRREALAHLAFKLQQEGLDAGTDKGHARKIVEKFLASPSGVAWDRDQARLGAAELINIDANTSGLLVERGPDEVAFCHAAFREHLAGLELGTWDLALQKDFARENADNPRWRAPIISMLQSLRRQSDIEGILGAIRGAAEHDVESTDRRLLLAEAAFSLASRGGQVALEVAADSLRQIEVGSNRAERIELLGMALDGPRSGPIGAAVVDRMKTWWPQTSRWRRELYQVLASWRSSPSLHHVLWRGLHDEDSRNRFSAAAALQQLRGTDPAFGKELACLFEFTEEPGIAAAALDTLARHWPSTNHLDEWIRDGARSQSDEIGAVAALARYRSGWRDEEAQRRLLGLLPELISGIPDTIVTELLTAVSTTWGADKNLQDACWAAIGRIGPKRTSMRYDTARHLLLRLHKHDTRVADWIAESYEADKAFYVGHGEDEEELLAAAIAPSEKARKAVDGYFEDKKASGHDYHAAKLAAQLKSSAAKKAMLRDLEQSLQYNFWPVWSLLNGWGMKDAEVSAALLRLVGERSPTELQNIAAYLPEIIPDQNETRRLLLEICASDKVERPDFVTKGMAAVPLIGEYEAVSALLPHINFPDTFASGASAFIQHFHKDQRVREFALQCFDDRYCPLEVIAKAYQDDSEFAPLIFAAASPLPSYLRRQLARRAAQRPDDPPLRHILTTCDLEEDGNAKIVATIGYSRSLVDEPEARDSWATELFEQLSAIGPDMDTRRVAALAGLVALERPDMIGRKIAETGDRDSLRIDLSRYGRDHSPAIELLAKEWDKIVPLLGRPSMRHFSRWSNFNEPSIWDSFAPYLRLPSTIADEFIEYCRSKDGVLSHVALSTLGRLVPRSALLLESCTRALRKPCKPTQDSPLFQTQSAVCASRILATSFATSGAALSALEGACNQEEINEGLIGLAVGWPAHEVLPRKYRELIVDAGSRHLTWPVHMWLVSIAGDPQLFVNSVANFAMRPELSPWDFRIETTAAIVARLRRDQAAREALSKCGIDFDRAGIRASVPALLKMAADHTSAQSLANRFIADSESSQGLKRFGLDVTANRIRRLELVLREVAGD